MTDGEQQIINMLMQVNNSVVALASMLKRMHEDGIRVKTQESHAP